MKVFVMNQTLKLIQYLMNLNMVMTVARDLQNLESWRPEAVSTLSEKMENEHFQPCMHIVVMCFQAIASHGST